MKKWFLNKINKKIIGQNKWEISADIFSNIFTVRIMCAMQFSKLGFQRWVRQTRFLISCNLHWAGEGKKEKNRTIQINKRSPRNYRCYQGIWRECSNRKWPDRYFWSDWHFWERDNLAANWLARKSWPYKADKLWQRSYCRDMLVEFRDAEPGYSTVNKNCMRGDWQRPESCRPV